MIPQGTVAQRGNHGAVHSAAQGVDGDFFSHNLLQFSDLFFNEFLIVHDDLLRVFPEPVPSEARVG